MTETEAALLDMLDKLCRFLTPDVQALMSEDDRRACSDLLFHAGILAAACRDEDEDEDANEDRFGALGQG